MKKHILESLFLSVLTLIFSVNAWADTTTLLEYGTANVAWSAENLTDWTAGGNPTISDGYVEITGGNGSYSTSKTIAPAANAVINVQAVWRGSSSTGRAFSAGNGSYFRFGNIIVAQNDQDKKHGYGFTGLGNIASVTTFSAGNYRVDITSSTWLLIEMEINTASNTLTSFTIKSEDGNTTYASASNVVLSEADYTTVAFGYRKEGGVNTTNKENLKSIKITQTTQTVETADYTVKYVCSDTEVKEAATRTGVVGQTISLNASDTENFYSNDKKYIFVSSDVEGKTVGEGVVVTVTFREAEKYAWTAKSNVGTYTISGETWEGDQASVKYPLYQLVNGKLWQKDATNQTFAQNFDVTENNQELSLVYSETEIDDVVFYAEVEDIEGMGVVNSGNAAARSSQRAAGYSVSGNTPITTLAPGIYRMVARFYSPTSAGGKYKFYAGNSEIWAKTTGNANATEDNVEFTLNEPKTISLGQCGATQAVDFIYIQKTGDVARTENYSADFNTAITTGNHEFKVASNWRHIVDTYESNYNYDPQYVSYSYSETAGVGGSGTLSCSSNQNSNGTYDLLVTPYVEGTVTIAAKTTGSYYTPQLTFYKVVEDGNGNLTRGDQISVDVSAVNSSDWTTVTIPMEEGARIGIRSSFVYLDDFTASSAIIVPEPSLTVTSVMSEANQTGYTGTNPTFEQQSDGTMLVKLHVALENTGDIDFVAGETENYTLTVAQASGTSNEKTYYEDASIDITKNLAVGAKDTIDAQFSVPYVSGYKYWFVRENVTGTTSSSYRYATSVAYEPKFVFRAAESTATSSITAAEAWGTITESYTKSFEIANTGTAPLTIKSITLPEGFTSDNMPEIPTEGLIIAKGAKQALNITQDATAQGTFVGDLTIKYLDKDAAEQTYTLAFSATVIGANTWTADFNNSTSTVVYPAGSVAESGIFKDYQYISSGNYNNWLVGSNSSSYASVNNKFITPKLHANAGDKLAFDVKAGYSSTDAYYVNVYVSNDRQTWGDPVETYVYSNTGSSFTTKTVSFDDAGDYYVAFAIYGSGSGIDNLVGLEKVDVAHDLYIKSISWPDASVKSGTALSKPSVDIIPLTDEAAENYTVKYIYGENEVEIASKALTTSANSTTSFAASFTPTVEATTTFPGTKVVFEFTDGTKFETETFDLTVTNEPIFHFQNAKYTSRWYEPSSDYTTPYNFGKTNEEASKTFWILNWGSAPLTVKSITVPEGFTTSVSTMSLPAFDGSQDGLETCQQSFDVTFTAAEAGTYSGNLVVTYVNGAGEDATFELAISGTKLDPSKYYANFDDQEWPAGSIYQDNVSISYINTGDYGLLSSSSTKNLFITPKLTATAGEKLQFDASTRNEYYNGSVKVYLSTDRETWGDPVKEIELSKTENTSKATYEYTFAAAGDYFIAFALNEARVDDIYGLAPVAVAHDWKIASSNIPTEAMQNMASTATVNVLNLGIADEAADSYTVTAYVNGEAAATGTAVALPMNHKLTDAGTQLSVNFRYPKTGEFPVYLEVKAGEYSVTTDPVNVTFAEEEVITEANVSGTTTSSYGPVYMGDKNCETISLYTAAILQASGLKSGDKIKSIAFKGYNISDETTSKFEVWYEWTDDQTLTQPTGELATEEYVAGMTKIANEESRSWPKAGSSSNYVNLIEFDFSSNPLIYQKDKSLRIVVRNQAAAYKGKNFVTTSYSNLYYRHSSDYASYTSASWSASTLPAIYFELDPTTTTIAGNVEGANGAATVTLVSTDGDNVQYTGTVTDGAYNVNVIQNNRTYNVTVNDATNTVVAKNVTFADGNVTKNFNFGTLTLDGEATAAPEATVWANVNMGRTLKAGDRFWNAIVLPFALSADEVTAKFGSGTVIVAYDGDETDAQDKVTVKFTKATAIEANVPYLVNVPADVVPTFQNADVAPAEAKATGTTFDFVGVYTKTDVEAGDYFVSGGKFKKTTTNNYVLAYRSYLQLKSAEARDIRIFIDGDELESEVTGINVVNSAAEAAGNIYNISGQKMNKTQKGLNIINGKKVMVK